MLYMSCRLSPVPTATLHTRSTVNDTVLDSRPSDCLSLDSALSVSVWLSSHPFPTMPSPSERAEIERPREKLQRRGRRRLPTRRARGRSRRDHRSPTLSYACSPYRVYAWRNTRVRGEVERSHTHGPAAARQRGGPGVAARALRRELARTAARSSEDGARRVNACRVFCTVPPGRRVDSSGAQPVCLDRGSHA